MQQLYQIIQIAIAGTPSTFIVKLVNTDCGIWFPLIMMWCCYTERQNKHCLFMIFNTSMHTYAEYLNWIYIQLHTFFNFFTSKHSCHRITVTGNDFLCSCPPSSGFHAGLYRLSSIQYCNKLVSLVTCWSAVLPFLACKSRQESSCVAIADFKGKFITLLTPRDALLFIITYKCLTGYMRTCD